jgi:hypothetical protein
MARTGNRVMKQKTEKAKVYNRESRKAREIGLSTPEDYRKSAVNITERPKKKEREEQEAADAASRAKHVDRIKGDAGPVAPLKIEAKDRELSSSAGHQDVAPVVKKKAIRNIAERSLGSGLSRVTKSGDIRQLIGDEKQVALNDLTINDKRLVKDANKRAQVKEEKETQARADVPKSVKERRTAKRTATAKEKIASAKAAPVATLPEAQAKPVSKPSTGKKVDGKWVRTDGPSQQPGEGKAGILNIADIADTAGQIRPGLRRRIERKARYNAMKAGKTRGYTEAAKLGARTSNVVNEKNAETSAKTDRLAREKASRIDANKESLQRSMLNRAKNMPKSTPEEKTAYKSVVDSGLSLIRKPAIIAKPESTSEIIDKDGKTRKVTSPEVVLRRGPKKKVTRPDERDLTKSYTKEVPVGAPRLGEAVSAMNYPIKMSRTGDVSAQADRPKETPFGVLGSHEDRMHALTKYIRVPVEGKEGGSDLEPVHLRSYLKSKSQAAGVRYNERDAVGAVFKARHKNPELFEKISREAIAHRTKRIGQQTEQRERGAAKAKEQRALASEGRGGKRRAPRAVRVMSNVTNKFTEVNNDGSQKS